MSTEVRPSFEDTLEEIVRKVFREEMQALALEDRLLTAEQVAELLAFSDVRSVYKLKREKKLPFVEFGENSYRFQQSDVRKFIEARKH